MAGSDSDARTALAYFQQLDAETAKLIYELIKTYCPSLIYVSMNENSWPH
jgi:hypothetical protein